MLDTLDGLSREERREFVGDVWVGVCMDEDLDYGPNVIAFGMVASGITRYEKGDQELLPDHKRRLLEKVGGVVHKRLRSAAKAANTAYVTTSHTRCGGGAAQGINQDSDLEAETRTMSENLGVEYLGHVSYAEEPVEVGNSNLHLHLGRPESRHEHWARRVVITVGGGITEAEIQHLESDEHGDAFIVSADVLAGAVEDGEIAEQEALDYLELHVDIADGIADGVTKESAVETFNAGRLTTQVIEANLALVNKLIARITK